MCAVYKLPPATKASTYIFFLLFSPHVSRDVEY